MNRLTWIEAFSEAGIPDRRGRGKREKKKTQYKWKHVEHFNKIILLTDKIISKSLSFLSLLYEFIQQMYKQAAPMCDAGECCALKSTYHLRPWATTYKTEQLFSIRYHSVCVNVLVLLHTLAWTSHKITS